MSIQRQAFETFKERITGEKVTEEDTPFIEMYSGVGEDQVERKILVNKFNYERGEGILLIYYRDTKDTTLFEKYNQGRVEPVNSTFKTYYQVSYIDDKWEYTIDLKEVSFTDFYETLERHVIKECFYHDLGL